MDEINQLYCKLSQVTSEFLHIIFQTIEYQIYYLVLAFQPVLSKIWSFFFFQLFFHTQSPLSLYFYC